MLPDNNFWSWALVGACLINVSVVYKGNACDECGLVVEDNIFYF